MGAMSECLKVMRLDNKHTILNLNTPEYSDSRCGHE